MMDQGPERDHTPDEAGGLFHFAPGDQPLCGDDCVARVYIDDPAAVAGCADCLELVAEDLQDENDYRGHCLHCRREITARGGVAPDRPAALPALRTGGMVMYSNPAPQGAIRGLYGLRPFLRVVPTRGSSALHRCSTNTLIKAHSRLTHSWCDPASST